MREETSEWLEPLLIAADGSGVEVSDLMAMATMPAAEADSLAIDWIGQYVDPRATFRALDWVRFGQLLRNRLGMDDTYPAYPDFPEARDVP